MLSSPFGKRPLGLAVSLVGFLVNPVMTISGLSVIPDTRRMASSRHLSSTIALGSSTSGSVVSESGNLQNVGPFVRRSGSGPEVRALPGDIQLIEFRILTVTLKMN
jgi:hypothetical protein